MSNYFEIIFGESLKLNIECDELSYNLKKIKKSNYFKKFEVIFDD